ncbi:ras-like protein [Anaeramoeba flamelloides]|uniref:Ras-like protein n=1 Tax=Anaeramoeba flamelloides TaxID=1746091 RepID=A0ABQ8XD79_9EUKA|nr:ras-like protein [Anaeramoeba flamelloides]
MSLKKLVVLGTPSVGKSAITFQLLQKYFVDFYDPTIQESFRTTFVVDRQPISCEIIDTAGQDEFSSLRSQYFQAGDGFIFVYSITSKKTLEGLSDFFLQMDRIKEDQPTPKILVGNKVDLSSARQVDQKVGEELAKKMNCPFFETSAKTRINIEESFYELVRQIRNMDNTKKTKKKSKQFRRCSIL